MQTEATFAAQQCTCSYHINYTNISFAKRVYLNQTPPFSRSHSNWLFPKWQGQNFTTSNTSKRMWQTISRSNFEGIL